jgi:uncharacterized membrane protein YbhN (UPF0104 family)
VLAAIVASLALIGVTALAVGPLLAPPLERLLSRIPSLGPAIARAVGLLGALRDHRRSMLVGTLMSLAAQVVLLGCYALSAQAAIGSGPLTLNALLAFFGLLANMLPVTPGGLGVGEAAFAHLFALFGTEGGAVVALIGRIGMIPAFGAGLALYASGVHRSKGWASRRVLPEERA